MVPIQHEILVVDDNPDILSLTRALLSEKGFKVRVANTGQGAVASCRLSPPDMVLLDLSLPDLSGYEVCSLLKEQVVTREIPVVFVSASHGTIDKVKAFSLGAVDFITKPFHEPELLARINTHLTISQLQRRLQEFSQELEQRVDQQTQELSRVYQASQTLSKELMFHPLLCNIIKSACECCEASKGMLVLKEQDGFALGAAYEYGRDPVVELRTFHPDSPLQVPWDIIQHVDQHQEPLVAYPETDTALCRADPYIQANHPAVLACLPLQYKDTGIGVVYLEYRDSTQALGDRHLQFLQVFLAQGAIYLGHAQLYQSAKENEDRLRVLLESAPDAILVLDVDRMKFCELNGQATTMFGYSEEALLEKGPLDLSPPLQAGDTSSQSLVQDYLHRALHGDQPVQFEWLHQDAAGRVFPCEVRLVQLPHPSANLVRASVLDISARKQAEQDLREKDTQLRQMQKLEALGTMAGGIAHDFNNILTAVIGYTHLLSSKLSVEDHKHDYIKAILTAGDRAKELIKQMLIFCRQTEPESEPVFLDKVFQETLTLVRGSLPSTIEIVSHVGPCHKPVWADPTQMGQVLLNLCTNAGHAMQEHGGVLEVGLEDVLLEPERASDLHVEPGPYFRFWVKDTGHGIDPENQIKIFDPFFTTKDPQEGTGLGLSVTHSILVRHHGAITVDSIPGTGTTFEIFLPVYLGDQTGEVPAAQGLSALYDLSGNSGKILFVEDEPSLAFFGKEVLTSLGYEVDIPSSSDEALEWFQAHPFYYDAVVTDQTMPRMTGEVLARHMLALRPHLPIILCTGFSHTMTEEQAQQMGIQGYLKKPYYPGQLAKLLHNVLAKTETRNDPPST